MDGDGADGGAAALAEPSPTRVHNEDGAAAASVISVEELAALERLEARQLREMVLRLLQESHALRARLSRQAAANEGLRDEASRMRKDIERMSCGSREPPEADLTHTGSTLPRVRRPKTSPRPPPPPPDLPAASAAAAAAVWPSLSAPVAPVPMRSGLAVEGAQSGGGGGEQGTARRNVAGPAVEGLPRRTVGAEPADLWKERPLQVVVRILPGAITGGAQWVDEIQLQLPPGADAAEVERLLAEQGLRWEPVRPRGWGAAESEEDCCVDSGNSRLLFKGFPLRRDGSCLAEQGVAQGGELRLLRSRAFPERLRSRSGHEPGAPRGLLLNPGAPRWTPALVRKRPEEFFDGMLPDDTARVAHISKLAYTKVGKTKPVYLDT